MQYYNFRSWLFSNPKIVSSVFRDPTVSFTFCRTIEARKLMNSDPEKINWRKSNLELSKFCMSKFFSVNVIISFCLSVFSTFLISVSFYLFVFLFFQYFDACQIFKFCLSVSVCFSVVVSACLFLTLCCYLCLFLRVSVNISACLFLSFFEYLSVLSYFVRS
jgi:hypothetical protein